MRRKIKMATLATLTILATAIFIKYLKPHQTTGAARVASALSAYDPQPSPHAESFILCNDPASFEQLRHTIASLGDTYKPTDQEMMFILKSSGCREVEHINIKETCCQTEIAGAGGLQVILVKGSTDGWMLLQDYLKYLRTLPHN